LQLSDDALTFTVIKGRDITASTLGQRFVREKKKSTERLDERDQLFQHHFPWPLEFCNDPN
jgi:hypothetical protein